MDADRFDMLAHALSAAGSRRAALATLVGGTLGWLASAETAAKKRKGKKKNRKDNRRRIQNPPPSCTPEPAVATCAGRCGTWPNNCGDFVTCPPCTEGKQCVGNGSCAFVCTDANPACPPGCGCSFPTAEGGRRCIVSATGCPTRPCKSTAECPFGQQCQTCFGGMGPGGCPQCATDPGLPTPMFCFPLCGA
jgi:hypothetical protein